MLKNRLKFLPILLTFLLAGCAGFSSEAEGGFGETAVPASQAANTAPTEKSMPTEVPVVHLPDLGPAPEFQNDTWLNADEPITLASLRGKVVLLEFWTFG